MRYLYAAISLIAFGGALPCASAAPVFHESGSNLTYGSASNADTVFMSTHNPAAAAVNLEADADVRMGILPNVGVGYEIGEADQFAEELDDLIDALDEDYATINDAQETADRFNALLPTIAEEGYVRAWGVAHVPAFPLVVRTDGLLEGAVALDITLSGEAWSGFFDDPVSVDPLDNSIESASAVYLKGAEITEFSAGYSRPLAKLGGGRLYAGGRLKYISMKLSKQVVALESVDDDEDVGDVIRDNYRDNQEQSAGVTVDAGVDWVRDNLRAGLTITNLTEPTFDYGEIGINCNDYSDPVKRDNCFAALFFADRFDRSETHTMERQATLEAAAGFYDRRLALSAGYDLNAVDDPVASEHQYLTLAAGWEPRSFWIPGIRLGYRKNMAGEQLSMITGGLRLLRVITLDVAYGLQDVEYDGDTYPRTASVNLGVEAQF